MYNKFIIDGDGVLKFGNVYLHRDLLGRGDSCPYGGGLWQIDVNRGAVMLYGRSFDFGPPCFEKVRCVDWEGVGGVPLSLLYVPHWPAEDILLPVCVNVF